MIEFSPTQKKAISRHLAKHGVKKCSVCRSKEWMPPMYIQPPTTFRKKDGALPFVTMVCRKCGHSVLFHAFVIQGFLDDAVITKEPIQPPQTTRGKAPRV